MSQDASFLGGGVCLENGTLEKEGGRRVVQVTIARVPEYRCSLLLPQEHHEEDFFLYIAYSDESVYGL